MWSEEEANTPLQARKGGCEFRAPPAHQCFLVPPTSCSSTHILVSFIQPVFLGFQFFSPNLPVLPGFPRQVDMQTVICSRFVAMILSSYQFSWVLPVYRHSLVHPIYQFSWVPTAYHFSWAPSTSYSFTHISVICRLASVLVL